MAPFPCHKRPAVAKKRGRVLDEDPERCERPRRHEVLAADPLRPRLRTGVDDGHVAEPELPRRALEERALPPDALDERDLRFRQRDRQGQTRESTTRAEIGNGSCIANGLDFERYGESATWTSTPRAGSRTEVMDAGSVATRSRSAARCDVACPGRPCRAASSSRRAWTAGDATMRTVRRETPRRPAIGAITHTTCGSNAAARGFSGGRRRALGPVRATRRARPPAPIQPTLRLTARGAERRS